MTPTQRSGTIFGGEKILEKLPATFGIVFCLFVCLFVWFPLQQNGHMEHDPYKINMMEFDPFYSSKCVFPDWI